MAFDAALGTFVPCEDEATEAQASKPERAKRVTPESVR